MRDQEYGGIGTEADSTIRAVERTAGIVATYRGAPIEALYSANAGGMTEDSENVYTNALPYLRSVPSPGDELAKDSGWGKTSWEWNREFTAPQLGDYLRSRGINVGRAAAGRAGARHGRGPRPARARPRHRGDARHREGCDALLLRAEEQHVHRRAHRGRRGGMGLMA